MRRHISCLLSVLVCVCLWLISPGNAAVIYISSPPSSGGGDVNTSYPTWDGYTKTGWGDQSNNLIHAFESGLGADQTGVGGGLAGADLVATQVNNVAAATGSPPSRLLDHDLNQAFNLTGPCGDALVFNAGKKWSVIQKLENLTPPAGHPYGNFYWIRNDATIIYLAIEVMVATGVIRIEMNDGGAEASSTTAAVPTSGVVWIAAWADAVNGLRFGWTTTGSGSGGQPTKWSDFAANNRNELVRKGDFSGFTTSTHALFRELTGATTAMGCKAYMNILSKICLINNAL